MWFTFSLSSFLALISLALAADLTIQVGGPDGVFIPNNLTVVIGDVVIFNFTNGNHSAIQSTFYAPCQPAHDSDMKLNGFNSGPRPTNNGTAITELRVPIGAEHINVTTWFYDGAPEECGWDLTAIGGFNLREESNETLAGYQRNAARLFGEEAQETLTSTRSTRPSSTNTSNSNAYRVLADRMTIIVTSVALVIGVGALL